MQDISSDPAAAKADLRKQAATRRDALMGADQDAAERLASQADIIIDIARR